MFAVHGRWVAVGCLLACLASAFGSTDAPVAPAGQAVRSSQTLSAGATPPSRPMAYEQFGHGKARYHAVVADMRSGRVVAELVASPRLVSVWDLVARSQATAAITGTFFNHTSQQPVADVLVDGKLVARGNRGSGVAVCWYGNVKIFDAKFKEPFDWGNYQFGLRGAVRVVGNGRVNPDPVGQAFRDSRIWGRAARTAVGVTSQGKFVMMATPDAVSLTELGNAMVSRGIVSGVSLDGGGSTCLYYQGSLVIPPKRKLNNMVVLKVLPEGQTRFAATAPRPTTASIVGPTASQQIASVRPVLGSKVAP
ncbi:MAG: phosphodiester glycosidase family protein [Fimbriimonadaceae bacterium]